MATGPSCAIVAITFLTWSGRARALPISESLLSWIFMASVPIEISEKSLRTSTPPDLQAGTGTSSSLISPVL